MSKNKTATLIALFLMSIFAMSLVSIPTTHAFDYTVYAFITVTPNPVGVGQDVVSIFWLDRPSPTAVAGYDPTRNWANFTVQVTSPSGKTENFGPYASDATGGNILHYTPNDVGNYTFVFNFAGQTFGTDYYKPASASTHLTVQEEQVAYYQTPPLPTGYWDYPINGENRGWWKISGNWLMPGYNCTGAMEPGSFNAYTTAPNTAHIVWNKQTAMGGVPGGELMGDYNFYLAPTYQYYWTPLAMGGRLYFPQRFIPGDNWLGMYCYDLSTGEEIWFQPNSKGYGSGSGGGGTIPTMVAQLLKYDGPNAHGVLPYLWNTGRNYTMFDANSGEPILTAVGAPATSYTAQVTGPLMMYDDIGSLLAYYIDSAHNWLCLWNSSKLIERAVGSWTNAYLPPAGATLDWTTGIEWNVTVPARGVGFNLGYPASTGNVIFAYSGSIATGGGYHNFTLVAYNKDTGNELWWKNITDPLLPTGSQPYLYFGPSRNGIFTIYRRQTLQWFAFDAKTGEQIWGPTDPYENSWDEYAYGNIAYDKLYVCTGSGRVYCHNLETGKLEWTYETPPSGFETPYGNWPFLVQYPDIADGKIYVVTAEHTPNSPYYLGGRLYCVNATTGAGIWSISGWWSQYYAGVTPIIVDGYLLDQNCLDGEIYCFGKGLTATTISAPLTAVTQGHSLTLTGTVTDQSPGQTCLGIPAAGTAAIADEYMTPWMEYLYMQKPRPANATGVTVSLDVLDANGNYRNIGTVTSDANGFYSFTWKPDIPGKYTVYATFAGSESYWSSMGQAAFTVEEAPAATPAPTPVPASAADLYFVPMSIGLFIAIIIAAVVIVLMLRKR